MNERIRNLSDHCIVCGLGRTGREAVTHLRARGLPFVVVERDPQVLESLAAQGVPAIIGNAHDNQVLEAAGIARARAVLACAGSDAENVFVTLTARSMRPDIAIACRCDLPESEPKLRRAGATSVVNPYAIAGRHLVGSVSRPGVFAFLESTVEADGELDFDELGVASGSPAVGRSIGDLEVGKSFQVAIVALRRADGSVVTNPGAVTELRSGDTILALGPKQQVERLRQLLEQGEARP